MRKKRAKSTTRTPKAPTKETLVADAGPMLTLDPRLPEPGTLLQKLDRHGTVRCECTVEQRGIRYAGTAYRSLSAAAMAAAKDLRLSNKTQNGFTFWGLSKPSRALADPLEMLNRVWQRYQGGAEAAVKSSTDDNRSALAGTIGEHARMIESLRGQVA